MPWHKEVCTLLRNATTSASKCNSTKRKHRYSTTLHAARGNLNYVCIFAALNAGGNGGKAPAGNGRGGREGGAADGGAARHTGVDDGTSASGRGGKGVTGKTTPSGSNASTATSSGGGGPGVSCL